MQSIVPIGNIKAAVAAFYGLPIEALTGKSRVRRVARPRQIAMALARERGMKLNRIANYFGRSDHSTVLAACDRIRVLSRDPKFLEELAAVRLLIEQQPRWNIEFSSRLATCKAIGEACRLLEDDLWYLAT